MKKYIIVILVLVIGFLSGYYLRDYRDRQKNKEVDAYLDSLGLFGDSNKDLDECLKKVNPSDPLGLNNETNIQKSQREECINNYKK